MRLLANMAATSTLHASSTPIISNSSSSHCVLDLFKVSLSTECTGDGSLRDCASSSSESTVRRDRLRLSATLIVQQGGGSRWTIGSRVHST